MVLKVGIKIRNININKKNVQFNNAVNTHKKFFKFNYWNLKKIRQKSTPSTQTRKKVKYLTIASTLACKNADHASSLNT